MYDIVVFASGSGTTLQTIIDNINNGMLKANICLVVSDNPEAYALERALQNFIPIYVIKNKTVADIDVELSDELKKYDIDLIVLAGYLKMIGENLIDKYTIINTHPGLLPEYGGKGMYGVHVQEAVLNAGEEYGGVTVHYVNSEYDKGDIIAQTKVKIEKEDTPETLFAKVQAAEKNQLVEVLKEFVAQNRIYFEYEKIELCKTCRLCRLFYTVLFILSRAGTRSALFHFATKFCYSSFFLSSSYPIAPIAAAIPPINI